MKARVQYIDIARGITIILMVLGHMCEMTSWRRWMIFSFHMPLFIIVSGYFFSDKHKVWDSFKSMVFKLLLPTWVVIAIVDIIIAVQDSSSIRNTFVGIIKKVVLFVSYKNVGDGVQWDYPYGTGVLWFIAIIFAIKIIYYIVYRISKQNIMIELIISMFLSLVGFCIATKYQYWLPWSFDVTLFSIPFFTLGRIMKKHGEDLENIYQSVPIMILLGMMWWWLFNNVGHIELATRSYPLGYTVYITAVVGCIFILGVSYYFEKYLSSISNILQWYGRNSFYILIAHDVELRLIPYHEVPFLSGNKIGIFVCKMIIVTLLAFIISRVVQISGESFRRNKVNKVNKYEQ